jgi:glucosamine-6-phosphate deaminase
VNYNELTFDEFRDRHPWRFNLVEDLDELNRTIAREAVDAIRDTGRAGERILIITPTGPLDYRYWADLCNRENISCEPLVTMNMDEYIEGQDQYIPEDHPLSFRRYLRETLVEHLKPELRPHPENLLFPDPRDPGRTTALIESFGGAALCFGGFGITGHFAFNDPPEPDAVCEDAAVRSSRTRVLTIPRESRTQMAMGGSGGNLDVIPERAVTLGMHELLMSKKIHLTFMRSWHAGVLRRALFGPVTGRCPGSFIQEHPNVEVTCTRLAADLPVSNVTQATGES